MKKIKVIAIFSTMFFISIADAACECHCVNGNMEALCSNAIDIRPICSPTVCPIVPPSVAPIEAPTIPPIGTSSCHQEQIYNSNTANYEWATICR